MLILQPYSKDAIRSASERLKKGDLVAFPTETVYGLGAHALSEEAVRKVFAAKGRPSSDPLIVHIASLDMAWPLVSLSDAVKTLFTHLARAFWPGPLTIVVPASACVPRAVTAGGTHVGLRWPAHPVAAELILAAGIPVAAPSANRFGHVSPTRADHVVADLEVADVLVLDAGPCPVGVESTVLKIDGDHALVVLRRGAVGTEALAEVLADARCAATLEVREHRITGPESDTAAPLDAPGQLLTHYAPDVPAFLLSSEHDGSPEIRGVRAGNAEVPFSSTVIIDFKGCFASFKDRSLAYADLSPVGSGEEAATRVFELLRWSEGVPGARIVLLPDLARESSPHALAVADRLFRAASGRRAVAK